VAYKEFAGGLGIAPTGPDSHRGPPAPVPGIPTAIAPAGNLGAGPAWGDAVDQTPTPHLRAERRARSTLLQTQGLQGAAAAAHAAPI